MAKIDIDISATIIDEFTRSMGSIVKANLPSTATTLKGTIVSIDNDDAVVELDGSTVTTTAELQVYAVAGDRVIVELGDHAATVIRNMTHRGGTPDIPNGDYQGYGTT